MLLAIDAGNTRVKWGVFDHTGQLSQQNACEHAALAAQHFPSAERVIIGNVAGEQLATQLETKLNHNGAIQWAKASETYPHLINQYEDPSRLGIDRWAAAIAAWHATNNSCLIVNAGTATTIDAVLIQNKQPQFIGGWILPGHALMLQSLRQNTAQIEKSLSDFQFDKKNPMVGFGLNTQSAINNGTMSAVIGAVTLGLKQLTELADNTPSVVISGGNARQIAANCDMPVILDEHIVLKGLYHLAFSSN